MMNLFKNPVTSNPNNEEYKSFMIYGKNRRIYKYIWKEIEDKICDGEFHTTWELNKILVKYYPEKSLPSVRSVYLKFGCLYCDYHLINCGMNDTYKFKMLKKPFG